MEQIGGSGHVSNLHVAVLVLAVELIWSGEDSRILVTKLEVSLHAAGGVLRALTIISVRE